MAFRPLVKSFPGPGSKKVRSEATPTALAANMSPLIWTWKKLKKARKYRMKKNLLFIKSLPFLFLFLGACSSTPIQTGPEWAHGSTRLVDHGYIVYVGTGSAPTLEKAQFKAEGIALEDLANECSMVPKGTRIEDRYTEKNKYETVAYVRIALEFKDCEEGKKAMEPADIKRVANVAFTQQLRGYQDLIETGEMADRTEYTDVMPPAEISPAPARDEHWSESTHFYVTRQYVAYQKEIVVLSPPTAYPPGSLQAKQFVSTVQPNVAQLETQQVAHPEFKTQPQAWSKLADRPKIDRPASLTKGSGKVAYKSVPSDYFKPSRKKMGQSNSSAPHAKRSKRKAHSQL